MELKVFLCNISGVPQHLSPRMTADKYIKGAFYYATKIPGISVGIQMGRSFSISLDQNIRDHLGGGPLGPVGKF